MKRTIVLLFVSLIVNIHGYAQENAKLMERLEAMLKVTQLQDLEKIMDYTYPKLFTIATREQLVEALKSSFESDDFSCSFDSVKVNKIFPVFSIQQGQYTKIKHTMLMRMKFKTYEDSTLENMMLPLMKAQFGDTYVRLDKGTKTLVILMDSELVAIKDEFAKEWGFVNYDDEDSLVKLLFSKEVIEKLKEYK